MNADAPIQWNCAQWSAGELNAKLRELAEGTTVELAGYRPQAGQVGLCCGLDRRVNIGIAGDVGDLLFFLGGEASLDVRGNAGDCLGHSMRSGRLSVTGSVANSAAAYATGGFIAVLGQARAYCAHGLSGADVFVRSRVGHHAGHAMRDGTLVLGNGCGEQLGSQMTGGVIYVRGDVTSKAPGLRQDRMKKSDLLRLSLLLAEAGIKSQGSEFRAFRPEGVML